MKLPDLPMNFDSDDGDYFITIANLEKWARTVVELKYPDITTASSDVFLLCRLWLNAYGDKFPENNFDNATLWVSVASWLDGYISWLEGNR